jgi:phytoene synthase
MSQVAGLATGADTPAAASASRARTSSFYLAMRILPKAQRQAMYEIYSFCRLVDDIADEAGSRAMRHAALDAWRGDIEALYAGRLPRPALQDLAVAIRTFDLRKEDFLAVIDGMDMDVAADIQAPDAATLDLYCDRVASAVGRLSVCIFGTPPGEREALAHHLGRALQLTNILRDIDEDAGINRLYLPREALAAAGISASDPVTVAADPRLPTACALLLDQAETHFAAADAVMKRCPRRTVRAPRVMYEAYRAILSGLRARGFAPPRPKVKIAKSRFLLLLLRHALF